MEERFKSYLEEQFRQIAPTRAAMEYRKATLLKMLDRAQELRIRGIDDEELIYNMVVGELGDFAKTLRDYENDTVRKVVARRRSLTATVVSIGYVFLMTLIFLIVGGTTKQWHPAWLILVGGILVGVAAGVMFGAVICVKKNQPILARIAAVGAIALISVFVFLILQLVVGLQGSWMTFLAMVVLAVGVDTVMAFASDSRLKWVELPIFVEVLCVMLYVILGLSLSMNGIANIWHPGWILCLGGVAVAIVEGVVAGALAGKSDKKNPDSKTAVDETYWTQW